MVSPVRGNPTSASPLRTAACTESPAFPSQESSCSTSRRSSGSLPQASFSTAARCSGAHSAARWNSPSICAQRSGVKWHLFVLHFLVKPGFRHPQVAPDGNRGNVQRLSNLFHRKPAKIAEFDGFAFSRINLVEGSEAIVQGHEVPGSLMLKAYGLIQRHFEPSTLTRLLPARMVHQDLAHQSRRHSKEMRPVLPARVCLIYEAQVGLMDKRRGLQRVPLAFFAQVAGGKLAEFAVHQGCEIIERPLVTLLPLSQQ